MRLLGLLIFGAAMIAGINYGDRVLALSFSQMTYFAFGVWFVAYTLLADADALAQTYMAHFEAAFVSTCEVLARLIAVSAISLGGYPVGAEEVITVCAASSSTAAAIMAFLLYARGRALRATAPANPSPDNSMIDPRRGRIFALANFVSTVVYLISSPPVIRIIAALGLDIIALAAFSFIQGLFISFQRVLPGLLVLPSLEPIMMSRLGSENRRDDWVYAGLSVIFKAELVCILATVILTCIAGREIIALLSRPAYAEYYYVFPVLVGSLVLITSYRIFETIANMHFKQSIFFGLWPLGVISMGAMIMTVREWGLWSVLLWPIVEITARIFILATVLRRYGIDRTFDPVRSISLLCCAVSAIGLVFVLRSNVQIDNGYVNLYWGLGGLLIFTGTIFLVRPLRPDEYHILMGALPAVFRPIVPAIRALTKPAPIPGR
jgi:hypothetical protein